LYYCFMNLAKALALCTGTSLTFDRARHGLSENIKPGGVELIDAFLIATRSPSKSHGKLQVFDELFKTLFGKGLPKSSLNFDLSVLLPQVLPGHRLWADAKKAKERFISLHEVRFCMDKASRKVWLCLYLFSDDLARLEVTHTRLIQESGLAPSFREVKCTEHRDGRKLICLEQKKPRSYTSRPSDVIPELVGDITRNLWATVGASHPFRRYYVYLAPPAESSSVLPQLLSVYAITFYLGSITRYRPQHFDAILSGEFGSRIEEFISGQPSQFVYLMASEFAQKEITQPSIV
jgi:hypothetical protein